MNVKKIHLVIAVLFAGLILFNGCKKSEPAPAPTSSGTMQGHEGHQHAAATTEPAEQAAATAEQAVATVEQTTCPVMGGAIDKNIFIEYKGKKVYFCCPGCEEQFKKEPEKFIAKLPQFQQ
jgi:YHS domain-containing protein